MARGMPSMVALLGLLAFAGYQNRDKIAEMLKQGQGQPGGQPLGNGAPAQNGIGGALSSLGDLFAGSALGQTIRSGLGDLLDGFRQNGSGEVADSWIKPGPNQPLTADQVEAAVGADNIAELSRRTGLSRDELLKRLATSIPEGVDKLTPDGRLPTEDEAARLMEVQGHA